MQPIFETPPEKYSAERVLRILLDRNISPSRICQERPVNITESATFVVDISKLQHEKDVLKDGFGKWNYSGSHPVPFHVTHHEDGYIAIEKCASGATGADVHLRRLHATHPSNSSFKRMIAFLAGMCYECVCCPGYRFSLVPQSLIYVQCFPQAKFKA